ncbi:MAG: 5,10-methylenetetrahydrofolate reductase [Desulfuromonadaceae bacterium]|nr:5,10-methylenetetrahydrofolate reductase [Desulfuromonadaceae bacterium]
MSRLSEQLAAGRFVVTAEIAPPKGVSIDLILEQATAMKEVTAINVTDNQGANMRMSPVAVAAVLVREGYEPVLQLTCRDRNRLALQSELLGASLLGIENLLLLSGDHPSFGDHPQSRPVFDLDSIHLLEVVKSLRAGFDMAGKPLCQAPSFFPGAAAVPEGEPFELMFQKYRKKVLAGARFFQTQAIFDTVRLERFMEAARLLGVPVLAGILLLKSARMCHFLNDNIPGVRVPRDVIERMEKASDPLEEGVAIARELVCFARGRCQGVHLMTLGQEKRIPDILANCGKQC